MRKVHPSGGGGGGGDASMTGVTPPSGQAEAAGGVDSIVLGSPTEDATNAARVGTTVSPR
jgi:hypothetical protein